jgi:uncharacterized repeat protein (TIGR02543 family)
MVTAKGVEYGAGIGTGKEGIVNGRIRIEKGTVYAFAYQDGAGIGTGQSGKVTGNIEIAGGNIYAYSESYERIGNGKGGTVGGNILITNPVQVKYDSVGGSVAPAAKTLYYADAYGAPSAVVTKPGYTFAGWYRNRFIYSNDVWWYPEEKINNTSKMLMTGAHTLTAHWTPIPYPVTFNANGGKVSPASKSVPYNTKYGALPAPKRKNYKFDGWYTAKSGGNKITANSIFKTIGGTTLYAHWLKQYTIKFNANKGKVSKKNKTVVYGKKYGKLPKASRKGYKFKGWYTKKSGGKKITSKSVVKIKKNQTLYAHWKKN